MTAKIKSVPSQSGILVSTAIRAGERGDPCPSGTCTNPKNHAEGLVLR
jgi:hypothetical protein